jgi:hypothetical protein
MTAVGAGGVPKWLLDPVALEQVSSSVVIPSDWRTYDVYFVGFNETAAAGDVRLQVNVQVMGDPGSDTVGTVQSAPAVTQTAAGLGIRQDILIASNLARAANGLARITAARDGANAADTLTGDYALARVELRRKS